MPRSGSVYKWRRLRALVRASDEAAQLVCWLDGQTIDYTLTTGPECWEPDHYYPVSTHPHLQFDRANLKPSHQKCNRARGNTSPTHLAAKSLGLFSREW